MYSGEEDNLYEFFLIQNMTEGEKSKKEVDSMGDGYLGMAS